MRAFRGFTRGHPTLARIVGKDGCSRRPMASSRSKVADRVTTTRVGLLALPPRHLRCQINVVSRRATDRPTYLATKPSHAVSLLGSRPGHSLSIAPPERQRRSSE